MTARSGSGISGFRKTGELGFEPRLVVFRWHSPRVVFTSQAIETPKVKRKPRFDHIARNVAFTGAVLPPFLEASDQIGWSVSFGTKMPFFISNSIVMPSPTKVADENLRCRNTIAPTGRPQLGCAGASPRHRRRRIACNRGSLP